MEQILKAGLTRAVRKGTLKVTMASGQTFVTGNEELPIVAIRFTSPAAQRAFCFNPREQFGYLYVDGGFVIEQGAVYDLLQVLLDGHQPEQIALPFSKLRGIYQWLHPRTHINDSKASRRNVAYHYDLKGELYSLFLDQDRQYSCAYFETPYQDLEEAQLVKKRRIAAKLNYGPQHDILDIGSGWGGLALYLAEAGHAHSVTGITLSEEQLKWSQNRAKTVGLDRKVRFELQDYRNVTQKFDRIVSVGMFEHVGRKSFSTFFQTIERLLKEDGVMLLHTIGDSGKAGPTNRWIVENIFPGGYIPTLSEIVAALEPLHFVITDIEVLRLHYAETLKNWRQRFSAKRDQARQLYDERFCKVWECYLAMAEAGFRFENLVVFQIQIAKRNNTLPMTRTYISDRLDAIKHNGERHENSPLCAALTIRYDRRSVKKRLKEGGRKLSSMKAFR